MNMLGLSLDIPDLIVLNLGGGGGPVPPETFNFETEGGQELDTEGGQGLEIEGGS